MQFIVCVSVYVYEAVCADCIVALSNIECCCCCSGRRLCLYSYCTVRIHSFAISDFYSFVFFFCLSSTQVLDSVYGDGGSSERALLAVCLTLKIGVYEACDRSRTPQSTKDSTVTVTSVNYTIDNNSFNAKAEFTLYVPFQFLETQHIGRDFSQIVVFVYN